MHYCLKHAVVALTSNTARRAWSPTPCIYISSLWCTHTQFHQAQQIQCILGWTCISDPNNQGYAYKGSYGGAHQPLPIVKFSGNSTLTSYQPSVWNVCEMCAMSAQAWASSNILPTKKQNLSVLNLHSFAMIVWLQRKTFINCSLAAFVSSWSHSNETKLWAASSSAWRLSCSSNPSAWVNTQATHACLCPRYKERLQKRKRSMKHWTELSRTKDSAWRHNTTYHALAKIEAAHGPAGQAMSRHEHSILTIHQNKCLKVY